MQAPKPRAGYSPASLVARFPAPSTLLLSSESAGWTSLLLEHNRVCAAPEPFEPLPTPDQTLVVQTRGEQHLESFRGGRWRRGYYRAGTVGLTEPDSTVRLRRRPAEAGAAFEKINLYIPQIVFTETAEHYRRAGHCGHARPLTALAFEDPYVAAVAAALLRAAAAGLPDLYAGVTAQTLAAHLLSAHSPWLQGVDDARDPGRLSDRRLKRVLDFMREHYTEALTLDRLAAEAGISKFHFARLFRERAGVTPHAYLVKLRLECAAHLLTTTDLQIEEVARHCGFASAAHFALIFSKRFGRSPTRFRRGDP